MSTDPPPSDAELRRQRQVIYWRLLAAVAGMTDSAPNVERMTAELVRRLGLPERITDPGLSVEALLLRYPDLKADFESLRLASGLGGEGPPGAEEATGASPGPAAQGAPPSLPGPESDLRPADLRRALAYSKLLLNAFGPNTLGGSVSAEQYGRWCRDVGQLENGFGFAPGALRGRRGGGAPAAGAGPGRLLGEEELHAGLAALEGDLVRRMALGEVLQDDELAARLTPSLPLLEQLLRDKADLSGNALDNARALIRRYVDQVADVLRSQFRQATRGKVDHRVPPRRAFRNLDLKRTLWRNLTRYNPEDGRLYVDRLYYRRSARKSTPTRIVVVVDQSGSMVEALVQCTVLASIFAGLPGTDVHLLAFDTRVFDLSPWVRDPFEVLLRTSLGGGTRIAQALAEAARRVEDPRQTAVVLVSDFYEGGSDQDLLDVLKGLKDSGVRIIPVGAVSASGYFSVNPFFRARLPEMGLPILSGGARTLIEELKGLL